MSEHSGITGKTPHQAARAEGAAKRQEARAQRSTADQIYLLDTRPGRSTKERTRLIMSEKY